MNWIAASGAGLPAFLLYFTVGAALIFVFATGYIRLTAHDEMALVRQGNAAAALALGGNIAGFSIPLDRVIAQASHLADLALWAVIAAFVQFLIYAVMRMLVPDLSAQLAANNIAAGILLASVSVVGGLLNAAAMTL